MIGQAVLATRRGVNRRSIVEQILRAAQAEGRSMNRWIQYTLAAAA
jgi:predicted HicB family RNase H-like nuclease